MTHHEIPHPRIRIVDGGKPEIFDILRGRYVAFTPEEKVRQYIIHLLIYKLSYPKPLMSSEVPLKVGKLTRRADIVVYNKKLKPVLLVECKAPDVPLSQEVLNQALNYNSTFRVPYVIITNGAHTACYRLNFKESSHQVLKNIPNYSDLSLV